MAYLMTTKHWLPNWQLLSAIWATIFSTCHGNQTLTAWNAVCTPSTFLNLDRKLRKLSMRCYRVNNIREVYSWLSVICTRPSRLQRNLLFDKVCIQKQHKLNEVFLYGRLVILCRILPYQMTYEICKPTVHMECNIQHTY